MRIVLYLFVLWLPSMTFATQITYIFSGELDRIQDDYSFLHGEFSVHDHFNGIFTYLTNVPEDATTVGDPTTAIYSSVTNFNVNIKGYKIEGNSSSMPGYVQVWDDRAVGTSSVDAFVASSPLDFAPSISGMGSGTVVAGADVSLLDFTHTAARGLNIPSNINLLDYGSPNFSAFQLNTDTRQGFYLYGTVTNLAAVPLPASVFLFISGLLFLLGMNNNYLRKL